MLEGERIHRVASALRTALIGHAVTSFTSDSLIGPEPTVGSAVEKVVSHGKHLEIVFDDGIVLHTHLRMTGAWHLYRHGEKWRRRRSQAHVVIETESWVAACFNTHSIETYREFDARRHPRYGRLGPDLCNQDADLHECVSRLMHYDDPDATIADVLMDQRVMCGIGNVFRCEVLWACGVHPWAPVSAIPQSTALDMVLTAAGQLRANAEASHRVTAPDVPGGLAVYGRNGQKCSRCGDIIRVTKHGEADRLLYWCGGCQVAFEPYPIIDPSDPVARAIDPHPAATQFLTELMHNRDHSASTGY